MTSCSPMPLLKEWAATVGDYVQKDDGSPPAGIRKLRAKLIDEEANEALVAIRTNGAKEEVAKELADIVYVTYGTALAYGIDLDQVIAEVHASNMSKLASGIQRRADGKILKGVSCREPDLSFV